MLEGQSFGLLGCCSRCTPERAYRKERHADARRACRSFGLLGNLLVVAWAAAVRQLATHDEPATALSAECAAILHYSMPPCTPPLFGEYIHPFNSLRVMHSFNESC
eukprot:scaffold49183_cov21-Tisochrysis_lutea.AAC.1